MVAGFWLANGLFIFLLANALADNAVSRYECNAKATFTTKRKVGCLARGFGSAINIFLARENPRTFIFGVMAKMKYLHKFIIFLLVAAAMNVSGSTMSIDIIYNENNYASTAWDQRGLIPSPLETITLMEQSTKSFLVQLKSVAENPPDEAKELNTKIMALVDALPWNQLDTEEKEFLADVLAPAIQSLGVNPWVFF